MENTNENKAKFKSLYWGQKVGRAKLSSTILSVNRTSFTTIDYLELKPLSSISDEDAIDLIKDTNYKNGSIEWVKRVIGSLCASTYYADKLRLKGFAIDWNGITVEQQLQMGWIKLT